VNCQQVREDIGVALITGGALDAETAAHVSICPGCAAEQASLTHVTSLMATLPASAVEPVAPSPAGELLLRRILDAVEVERARSRRRTRAFRAVWVAAAVLVVMLGVAVVTDAFSPAPAVIRASAAAPGIHATAEIVAQRGGSSLDVAITGVPANTDCVLWVHTTDGKVQSVASWRAEYDGTAHVSGDVAAAPGSIASVTIAQADGPRLLEIPVGA
jgi:hypothetical protein